MKFYYLPTSPGIYCFENIITKVVYIGSSICLYGRVFNHIWHLQKGIHSNDHFQNAYNKYGAENFIVFCLEICEIKNLLIREQAYFDILLYSREYLSSKGKDSRFRELAYNITPTAGNSLGFKHSDETILKIIQNSIDQWKNPNTVSKYFTTIKNEKWIEDWKERQQLTGRYGAEFRNKLSESLRKSDKVFRSPVLIYERITGKLITISDSFAEAVYLLDSHRTTVQKVLSGERELEEYMIFYKTSDNFALQIEPKPYVPYERKKRKTGYKIYNRKSRSVIQLEGDGETIIQVFKNATVAEEFLNSEGIKVSSSSISKVCAEQRNRPTAGGFKWMFKDKYEEKFGKLEN